MALKKYEIPRRSLSCHKGKEEFAQGMEYVSQLISKDDEGYERYDYCLTCWGGAENRDAGIHWRSKVPDKGSLAKEEQFKSRNDKALYLLKQEISDAEKFVLGLLLTRFKVLVSREETEQDGQLVTLYEVVETEEMVAVPKVDLSTLETETLQAEIAKRLHG